MASIGDIDLDGALTLSVGWRTGKKLRMAQILVRSDVEMVFRSVVAECIENLEGRASEPWTPEGDLAPETYLTAPVACLGEEPVMAAEHGDQSFGEVVQSAQELAVIAPQDLPKRDLELYVVTVGSDESGRAAFVRRANPRRGLRAGRMLTSFRDVLTRIEDPVFAFDNMVDLVFFDDEVHVLSQVAFSMLFRNQDALRAQIPRWVNAVVESIPFEQQTKQMVIDKALRDTRLARRLETIASRGHLAGISMDHLRAKMQDVGLDPDAMISSNGEILVSEQGIPHLLYFLNEDLFSGVITNQGFRADKKAAT